MLKPLLIFFLFFLSCSTKQDIPDIKVRDLNGNVVKLSLLKGNPVLIYVWSKTCAGHTKDLKLLNDLVDKYKNYHIVSYAVAMEYQDVVRDYEKLGIEPKFITFVDTSIEFNKYYPIVYLPSTYIFNEKGEFVKSVYGLPEDL